MYSPRVHEEELTQSSFTRMIPATFPDLKGYIQCLINKYFNPAYDLPLLKFLTSIVFSYTLTSQPCLRMVNSSLLLRIKVLSFIGEGLLCPTPLTYMISISHHKFILPMRKLSLRKINLFTS